tara:strand:- start:2116 stop:2427 length:312 start_codon:yes stop_codon:yes gene_type:complete
LKQTRESRLDVKVGDLVEYRPPFTWRPSEFPQGIVIAESFATVKKHHRIRVMWLGDIPIQASSLATSENKRVTTWVNPKHFFTINRAEDKENEMDEESFTSQT